jgi:ankyrin repeat protein
MRVLLAYGADPNITASDKTTPLMAAAGIGWLPSLVYTRNENLIETLKLCLELGNPINAINDGKPNAGGPFGVTALHGAAFKGLPEAIQFLVDRGSDLFAKDNISTRNVAGTPEIGRTPLNWAEGLSFEGQSPRREEKAVALLRKLMDAAAATISAPISLTANALALLSSAASTSVYAAALMSSSGLNPDTILSTAARSAMSTVSTSWPAASPASPNTVIRSRPSWPFAPNMSVLTWSLFRRAKTENTSRVERNDIDFAVRVLTKRRDSGERADLRGPIRELSGGAVDDPKRPNQRAQVISEEIRPIEARFVRSAVHIAACY